MRILVVGGSRFVGRHMVEAAVAGGHDVWLANRGKTTTEVFGAEGLLRIDRESGDYAAVTSHAADQAFDAVLDASAYVPRHVAQLHAALHGGALHSGTSGAGAADRYLLISSVSAYDPADMASTVDEGTALAAPVRDTETVTGATYGGLKVACEEDAEQLWGDALTVVRPGIVAGPHDHTDRFTWWVRNLSTAGDFAAGPQQLPADPAQSVQVIDGRDLAAFCLKLVADRAHVAVDATGDVLQLRQMVAAVWTGLPDDQRRDASWVPLDSVAEDQRPPLVLDPADGQVGIFDRVSTLADDLGLDRRPVPDTVTDLHAWDVARGLPPLAV